MVLKDKINASKFLQVVLIAFAVIQGISWVLAELDVFPIIKGGWFLLLMLIVISLTTLFSLGRNITALNLKKDLIFILLVFGGIVAAFIFLPQVVPQIFSTQALEMSEYIKQTINSVIGLLPGGITPR